MLAELKDFDPVVFKDIMVLMVLPMAIVMLMCWACSKDNGGGGGF